MCARIVQSRVWIPCMVGMSLFHDVILLVIKLKRWGGGSLHDLGLMQRRLSALNDARKSQELCGIGYKRILVTLLSTQLNSSVKWPHVSWGHINDGTCTCHVRSLWRHSLPCSYTASRVDKSAAISSPTETVEFAFWQVVNNSKWCKINTWN
jgi:hypothetical protein